MRCFDHPISESVGICKNCQKGLCHECLVDCGDGLACKGCEEKVKTLNRFLENSIHKKTNNPFILSLINGTFFIVFGISMQYYFSMDLFAVIFILFGCTFYFNAYRHRALKDKSN